MCGEECEMAFRQGQRILEAEHAETDDAQELVLRCDVRP